jgi:adenylate kinase
MMSFDAHLTSGAAGSAAAHQADQTPVRLVMLGPPGAGKGTQAQRFARKCNVPWISTGAMLRDEIQNGTALGRAARSVMDAGQLVSDDRVIEIVRERLLQHDVARGFVLDGFPRSLPQAQSLDQLIDDRAPLVIVDIEVPEDVLVTRLQSRRICRKCSKNAAPGLTECDNCGGELVQRSDDNSEVVRERLRVYDRSTHPIVEYYRPRATFRSVDGDQTLDSVAADIAAAVASVVGSRR